MLLFADLIQKSQEKYIVLNIVHRKNNLKGGFSFFKVIKLGHACISVDKLRSLFCEIE